MRDLTTIYWFYRLASWQLVIKATASLVFSCGEEINHFNGAAQEFRRLRQLHPPTINTSKSICKPIKTRYSVFF